MLLNVLIVLAVVSYPLAGTVTHELLAVGVGVLLIGVITSNLVRDLKRNDSFKA